MRIPEIMVRVGKGRVPWGKGEGQTGVWCGVGLVFYRMAIIAGKMEACTNVEKLPVQV